MKEVNSQSLQYALRCLETAYQNFFRGRARFPRFKSKRHKNSFRVPQFVRLEEGRLHLPKFQTGIKEKVHRPINGQIKHCTVSRTASGNYFVSLVCEEMYRPKEVARLHDKIKNSRMDRSHKVSHELVSTYDLLCVEDLHVKGNGQKPKTSQTHFGCFLGGIGAVAVIQSGLERQENSEDFALVSQQ